MTISNILICPLQEKDCCINMKTESVLEKNGVTKIDGKWYVYTFIFFKIISDIWNVNWFTILEHTNNLYTERSQAVRIQLIYLRLLVYILQYFCLECLVSLTRHSEIRGFLIISATLVLIFVVKFTFGNYGKHLTF